ncbi:hypothetical protein HYN48_01585 [Flavobacterium magnum]|uniref:Secretion system C-terminal sorting domain-containing protein n=1 Tax=Flavobacterium magnum TaxID=2162713 RepID=A0A2S0RCR3_9FLAO|nr:YCF48-related protein [Flavobacterium magnum]AWA28881.1 hypothetical protein HYN48_01585 [Flavobacterium magnum]
MAKFYLPQIKKQLVPVLMILMALPAFSQWTAQNSGVNSDLKGVCCISENAVVVVGANGTILKTTDGGMNWNQKTPVNSSDLQKVQFANGLAGFAIGASGTLLKTTDAGETWTAMDTGETADFYGLSVLDETTFYISGDNGTIKKSADGGSTFTALQAGLTESVDSVQFLNAYMGYAESGGILYKTADGGSSWTQVANPGIDSFFFLDENTGFLNAAGSGFFKTSDGGTTLESLGSSALFFTRLFSLNEHAVWGVENIETLCGCATHCVVKGEMTNTNYEDVKNCGLGGGDGIAFSDIHFANDTTGFIVGTGGAIYKNSTGVMLGQTSLTKDSVAVYPNPASANLTVSVPDQSGAAFSIEITDVSGKRIFSGDYHHRQTATINVQSFSKGMYLLTVTGSGAKHMEKIVVN